MRSGGFSRRSVGDVRNPPDMAGMRGTVFQLRPRRSGREAASQPDRVGHLRRRSAFRVNDDQGGSSLRGIAMWPDKRESLAINVSRYAGDCAHRVDDQHRWPEQGGIAAIHGWLRRHTYLT